MEEIEIKATILRFPDGAREKIEKGEYVECPNCGMPVVFNATGYICFSLKCNGRTTIAPRQEAPHDDAEI